jgi:hypothetical protein
VLGCFDQKAVWLMSERCRVGRMLRGVCLLARHGWDIQHMPCLSCLSYRVVVAWNELSTRGMVRYPVSVRVTLDGRRTANQERHS